MRTYRWFSLFVVCAGLVGIFPILGYSAESDDANLKTLSDLLTELEQKIEEADKRMIAHPKFLEELRTLVDQYRARVREVFFDDNFSDGDYARNPKWVVDSGRFQITSSRRLWSSVPVERPARPSSSKKQSDTLGGILEEIVRSTVEERETGDAPQEAEQASIRTRARIGSDFEVDLTMVSRSSWGSTEVVLLGGDPPTPRYRIVYHAAPSAERPIEIIRERGSRRYLIESATRYPVLDDETPHRIQWIRDSQGQMRILVDGNEVLSTVELFYRTAFSGLALVNRGGTYEWGPIRVLQAPKGTR
jgi:hypothetical protein